MRDLAGILRCRDVAFIRILQPAHYLAGSIVPNHKLSTEMLRSKLLIPGLALGFACAAFAQVGTTFCAATANSTGLPASLTGSFGSGTGSGLHLEVQDGVPNQIGYFLVGNEATTGVAISSGLLCLVGTSTAQVYRYNIAGTPQNSVGVFGSRGTLTNVVGTSLVGSGFDVPSIIPSGVPLPIMTGDTWNFQLWYRDTAVMAGNSNFSNGLSVTFIPPQQRLGMVLIPSGTFNMGSMAVRAPYFASSDEQPVHSVTIANDFWMGQSEVTQGEYQTLMGNNPSHFVSISFPVSAVSWDDARAYCAALTAQESALGRVPAGYEYRLPTEAEWEYACRAGTTTEYNIGNTLFCADAQIGDSIHSGIFCNNSEMTTEGSFPANAWGLYNMHGNMEEWCLDSFGAYVPGAVTDPFVTGGGDRVLRSGNWHSNSSQCRSSARSSSSPVLAMPEFGFRVVFAEILIP